MEPLSPPTDYGRSGPRVAFWICAGTGVLAMAVAWCWFGLAVYEEHSEQGKALTAGASMDGFAAIFGGVPLALAHVIGLILHLILGWRCWLARGIFFGAAYYFVDPEGNGLELYIDRTRDEWVWDDGEVQMGAAVLDPNAFIEEHLDGSAGAGAAMGHVHLKVGDLAQAEAFYADALGFAVTARSDGALFYAADGYHHHLATNTWQSERAGERANTTGLGSFAVTVRASAELDAIAERLDDAGIAHTRDGDEMMTSDPWGNEVRIVVA